MSPPHPNITLFPYTTLFRSEIHAIRSGSPEQSRAVPTSAVRQRLGRLDRSEQRRKPGLDRETSPDQRLRDVPTGRGDRKSTRLNSSHTVISYAVFCLKKKKR